MSLSQLHVVSVVFNPRRFASRYRLYRDFAAWLVRCNVPLLTVEIAFGDRPWEVTEAGNAWHLQLRTRHELWHKERGLNLGIQRLGQLAPGWEYVAWIDADIHIARPDWHTETVHLLQHYAVLQLFGECRSLDPDHHALKFCAQMGSIMRQFENTGGVEWHDNPGLTPCKPSQRPVQTGHPGLCWAFRRAELDRIGGLLDVCVNGSGDLHMACCFAGVPLVALPRGMHPSYVRAIERYGDRCERWIGRNVSYLPGAVDHYWHGRSVDRGYDWRWKLLIKHQFDPVEDLLVDTSGLFRWAGNKPALAVDTRKSLRSRNEDGTEV